jgi:putative methyltransferase (TIGR04325 family)
MKIKQAMGLFIPPIVLHAYKALRRNRLENNGYESQSNYLHGNYASWSEALSESSGYDNEIILAKTREALLKVKNGEAGYERDSVLFDEIHYSWPLLAGLMWVAAQYRGSLNVLDFGGSFGSTYFQNRSFLQQLPYVRWNIIEQPRHVKIGRALFEDDFLRFYTDITECLADTQPIVVVLSSVLQYLERPYTILDQILQISCDYLIVDRTPFWAGSTDHLCVQTIPPNIYPASYPSWIFSRPRFFSHIHEDWKIMVTFDCPDKLTGPIDFSYQGMIIARSKQIS